MDNAFGPPKVFDLLSGMDQATAKDMLRELWTATCQGSSSSCVSEGLINLRQKADRQAVERWWRKQGGKRIIWVSKGKDAGSLNFQNQHPSKFYQSPGNDALLNTVITKFSDGEWHPIDVVAKSIDLDEDELVFLLQEARTRVSDWNIDVRVDGIEALCRFSKREQTTALSELIAKCGPFIDELIAEGQKTEYRISPGTVLRAATLIKRTFEECVS
jgi:hypothetical protein